MLTHPHAYPHLPPAPPAVESILRTIAHNVESGSLTVLEGMQQAARFGARRERACVMQLVGRSIRDHEQVVELGRRVNLQPILAGPEPALPW